MGTYEGQLKSIETKLALLQFTDEETANIIEKAQLSSLERQRKIVERKVDEVHNLKVEIQEAKLQRGEKTGDIKEWTGEIDAALSKFEHSISEMEKIAKEIKRKKLEEEKQAELSFTAQMKEKQFEKELQFEEEKHEKRLHLEKKFGEESKGYATSHAQKVVNSKLPKLVITPFNGTHADWLRFWNQFEAEIDSTQIPTVTKFSYLKELVEKKVRVSIDGLPFNSEGYERAKNILNSRYGKISEIVNAYVQAILALPHTHGSQPAKIYDFYEKLLTNVQSLETLGRLKEIAGYVRMTLDKLEGIRGDLVRTDDDWQEWDFPQLVEVLRKWTERNPLKQDDRATEKPPPGGSQWHKRSKTFQTKQREWKPRACVYCEGTGHKASDCNKVVSVDERKKILSEKQLCFNCTGTGHQVAECRCRTGCLYCKRRHHTSICDRGTTEQMLVATGDSAVTYPVVVVNVEGIKCRALLDTGAGSSYASAALLDRLRKRPIRKELRRIEMMVQSANQMIELHKLKISSLHESFHLETEVTKVNRSKLLSLGNPKYEEKIARFSHLRGISMDDTDQKPELPIHLVLGASEYAKIKTVSMPRVGQPGEPIAELTRFGWTVMSPGKEVDLTPMFLTQTSSFDYENLCRLDVLGLEDSATGDQASVYEEFKEQLKRSPDGWYEVNLPWKGNHPPLPSNEKGSLKRLEALTRKLEKQPGMLERYNDVIQDQRTQGIVEPVTGEAKGREFYIPHKPVIRETAESTKLRIVYDASARAHEKAPSLNECLETGPPLQNLLWSVLVRNRLHSVAIAGDLKQAFLQVRIWEPDRDAMRFHWYRDLNTKETETLRFTRALFGLAPSPFLLGGVLREHLECCRERFPVEVEEILRSLYVDDLISGGATVQKAQHLKESAQAIFSEAQFELHKWHSNIPVLETDVTGSSEQESSYAKQQLGAKQGETKLLGMPWNKEEDTIAVTFPSPLEQPTKRDLLGSLARIYDPLGLVSPTTLTGKMLYRDVCDSRIAWDKTLPRLLLNRWTAWKNCLPEKVEIPRSLAKYQEETEAIDLHGFGDASGKGVSAAVYTVIHQAQGINQGLLTAKSRLSKKGLTIPRQELVSAHMAANLIHNVKTALSGFPVRSVYCWLDSSVALHWLKGNGDYKQFVANRVRKIQQHDFIQWRHVKSEDNPADLGSRGGQVDVSADLWWQGPEWLTKPDCWPPDIVTRPTPETQVEAKAIKEVLAVTVTEEDILNGILEKHEFWKAIRIVSWIGRFLYNCKTKDAAKKTGPLTTEETEERIAKWVRTVQSRSQMTEKFQSDNLSLNLQENHQGILECRGRIQGDYPVYLPDKELFSEKLVAHAHKTTLHGGVGLTMAKVRERYWVPRLRRLTKRVIRNCNGCKRFQAIAYARPPQGNLPRDRTEGSSPFQVIGVDYAGPIKYRTRGRKEGKAYIVLFACSLTRGLYLELLPDLTTEEFIGSLKRLVARRGRPEKIYSDNGKTFVAASKWLKQVERVHNWLATHGIKWQFNLSRAPWWGGQFERLVGLVKQSLYKTIGNGNLLWKELQEVILDIEIALNNRPLSYVEEDVQLPMLTPNALLFGQPNLLPEMDPDRMEEADLRKRAKYLLRCKEVLWSRWTREYVKALRERHNLIHKTKSMSVKAGDVVLIKGEERNRGKWKLGVVDTSIPGRDGVVRAVRLKAGKSFLERPIQHLYPLELTCDMPAKRGTPLNAEAQVFRPTRQAAAVAQERIRAMMNAEDED